MATDFKKKQPTKAEQMFYDMAMSMDMLDRRLWTTSSFVTALAVISGAKPERIAQMLTDQKEIQEFSKQINEAIDKIEKERSKAAPAEGAEPKAEHNHDHAGHDHNHEGHTH